MLIVCPSCASEYVIEAARLGPEGRHVRCAACRGSWFVAPAADPPTGADGAAARPPGGVAVDAADGPGPDPGADPNAGPGEATAPGADATSEATSEAPAGETSDAVPGAEAFARAAPGEPLASAGGTIEVAASAARVNGGSGPPGPRRAGRRAGGSAPSDPSRPGFLRSRRRLALAAGGVALLAALVPARGAIVARLPGAARLYAAIGLPVNLRGLELRDVAARTESGPDGPILVVEGDLANVLGRDAPVPMLALELRDEHDAPLYRWTAEPPRPTLAAAESVRFRARLAAPPAGARRALVRLAPSVEPPVVVAEAREGAREAAHGRTQGPGPTSEQPSGHSSGHSSERPAAQAPKAGPALH